MVLDLAVSYQGDASFGVAIMKVPPSPAFCLSSLVSLLPAQVPAGLSSLELSGVLRVSLLLSPAPPLLAAVQLAFLDHPVLQYDLQVLAWPTPQFAVVLYFCSAVVL